MGSGVALLFGLMRKKTASVMNYGPECQRHPRASAASRTIYVASCASLLAAGTSLLTTVGLVAWKTAPIISKPFFITFSCVFPILLLLAWIDWGLRNCSHPMF
ncbi:hypothetical protein BOTBODRAFT_49984 [Botryobasidium botryosum FD-172 SS1]|uniref:Uncharacterized protein n=1 Tax=Botryobasidium botryosum (strain FD-172 SS1) TaxID=930990 RepID=A0A067N045_BOTB1|nr:hypothetical protein BOTBODRAFT_49984 [Botryobasidium botryosum FD-172 SS1]